MTQTTSERTTTRAKLATIGEVLLAFVALHALLDVVFMLLMMLTTP